MLIYADKIKLKRFSSVLNTIFDEIQTDSVNAFIGKDKITDLVSCLSSWPPAILKEVSKFYF